MKNNKLSRVACLLSFFFVVFSAVPGTAVAQAKYRSENLTISIKGTASAENWELKSDKGELEAVFGFDSRLKVSGLYSLWFTVGTESLKGDYGAMESSAYKALKSKDFDNISFIHKSSTINQLDANRFDILCIGYLTVAGSEQETNLVVSCTLNDDTTYTCTGTKKLKMTDFNIKAPSVAKGIIKAADDISISYNATITRR